MSCRAVLVLLAVAAAAAAQPAGEDEAYRDVATARDRARASPTADACATFDREAERFLARFPRGRWADVVWLWRGDLARQRDARAALRAYANSKEPAAAERARALAFRQEEPPPLDAQEWSGDAVDVAAPSGDVTLLVFFSVTHPQTQKLLPHLMRLHEAYRGKGLRLVGVMSVVDDHERQRPPALLAWAAERKLPFPCAVDRQRPGARSRSLEAYQGNQLPWAALLDRYGRIASLQAYSAQGNPAAQTEQDIRVLLDQPPHRELVRRIREGGAGAEPALSFLASIRNRATADALFDLCCGGASEALRARARAALLELLPDGFLGDDAAGTHALWRSDRDRFRYDFAADRIVPKR